MGRGGGGSGGSHGGGGGHFNYGSSRGGGHSRGGGCSSSNYSPVYRTSYYRPMTPLGGTLSIILAIIVIVAGLIAARPNIQQSTVERSKLDSSLCTKVDTWYQDDINWIHYSKVSRCSMTKQEYNHICGLPTISMVRQNQTPVTLKQL